MTGVAIAGDGVAARLACAVFRRAGIAAAVQPDVGGTPPVAVMLNAGTLALLADLFGDAAVRSLRTAGTLLTRRVVSWDGEAATRGPAELLLVPLARLGEITQTLAPAVVAEPSVALDISCRGRRHNPDPPVGPRFAFAWNDVPALPILDRAAWTVAARGGWAFAATTGPSRMIVQVVVPDNDADWARAVAAAALDRATLRHSLDRQPADFRGDAAPRFAPASPSGAMRLGDEQLALDPLCGDGIGHALRAAALLAALARGNWLADSRGGTIYEHRLRVAFVTHLRRCEGHYAGIAEAGAWRSTLTAMRRRRRSEEAALAASAVCSYRLDRLSLSLGLGPHQAPGPLASQPSHGWTEGESPRSRATPTGEAVSVN